MPITTGNAPKALWGQPMARLSASDRRGLSSSQFAAPGKGKGEGGKGSGSYPIPDEKHARSALSLVSQHGSSERKAQVRAAVKRKYPGIKQEAMHNHGGCAFHDGGRCAHG